MIVLTSINGSKISVNEKLILFIEPRENLDVLALKSKVVFSDRMVLLIKETPEEIEIIIHNQKVFKQSAKNDRNAIRDYP